MAAHRHARGLRRRRPLRASLDLGRPEFADLTVALNAAASEIERSEDARRQLTADIAHELRTPLTALQVGLEELRDGLVPADPATLAALHDQATRLGRIVNDLAELSAAVESAGCSSHLVRVELGVRSPTWPRPSTGAMSAAGLSSRASRTGDIVLADADRLHQVVGNLLANAPGTAAPAIEVSCGSSPGRLGVLEVSDTGPGLRADERRCGSSTALAWPERPWDTGFGLGLPIVRALVLAEGGQVTLSSRGRQGDGGARRPTRCRTDPDDPDSPHGHGHGHGGVRQPPVTDASRSARRSRPPRTIAP